VRRPLRKTLRLPWHMRWELKRPLGLLIGGEDAAERFKEILEERRPRMLAVVGDISTRNLLEAGVNPDIVVMD